MYYKQFQKGDKAMVKEKPIKPTRVKRDQSSLAKQAIKKLYNKSAPMLLFEALLFLAASIFIFVKPVPVMATITVVFGIVLGFIGLYQLFVGFFGEQNEMAGKTMNIILGLVKAGVGAFFFLQPAGSMITVIYIFAILFLIKSIATMVFSLRMFRAKIGSVMDVVTSVIMVALGILVLFFPTFGIVTAMYFIALVLLFYAIADITMYVKLLKLKKTIA